MLRKNRNVNFIYVFEELKLSNSLLDKTPINEILTKCDYKDVKELDYKQLIISGF